MPNIRLIRRRIRGARNISQITRAMEMVAASKMKKAQGAAVGGKPYAQKIYEATSEFISKAKIDPLLFPLLRQEKTGEKILVILVSTNKGLCGGLNTNLFRALNLWYPPNLGVDYITFGKKGEGFVVRSGRKLVADFSSGPFLENVGAATSLAVSGFTARQYQEVCLVYNDFLSILKQAPVRKMILPIGISQEKIALVDFLIEPGLQDILSALLPHYLEIQVRAAILEAEASEHSARMMAMKAATDNAQSLMAELTLDYNKIRQQLITYEIADIVTAREAIKL